MEKFRGSRMYTTGLGVYAQSHRMSMLPLYQGSLPLSSLFAVRPVSKLDPFLTPRMVPSLSKVNLSGHSSTGTNLSTTPVEDCIWLRSDELAKLLDMTTILLTGAESEDAISKRASTNSERSFVGDIFGDRQQQTDDSQKMTGKNVEITEKCALRTRAGRTGGRTDGRTDGRADGRMRSFFASKSPPSTDPRYLPWFLPPSHLK